MSDNQRNGVSTADLLGPVVFMGASVVGVSVVIALLRGIPDEGASGIGALARFVVLGFGYAPALLFAIGGAYVGARIFLKGEFQSAGRDLSGIVGTSAGLAILLGTLSETAGGGFGGTVGGFLSTYLTKVFGGIVGLAAFLAPIWLTWLQEGARSGRKSSKEDRLSIARGLGVGTAPEVDAEDLSSGVSAEEAQALLPDSEKVEADEATALAKPDYEEVLAGGVPAWALKNESANPYPEDPRLVGDVPQGARPLEDNDAESGTEPQKSDHADDLSTVQRWTPSRGAEAVDASDGDLAHDASGEQGVVDPGVREHAEAATGKGAELESAASLVEPAPAPVKAEPLKPVASSRGGIEVLAVEANVPRPSWETATQEVEDEAESEPDSSSSSSTLWRPDSAKVEAEQAPIEEVEGIEEPEDDAASVEVLAADPEEGSQDDEWEAAEVVEPVEEEADQAALADVEEETSEPEDVEAAADDEEYEYVEVEDGDEEEEGAEAAEDDEEYEYVEVEDGEEEEDGVEAADDGDENELVEVEEGDEEEDDAEAAEDDEEYEYVEVEEGDEDEEGVEAAGDDEEYEYVEVEEGDEDDDDAEAAGDDEEYEYVEVEEGDEDGEDAEAADDDEEYEYVEVDEDDEGEEAAGDDEEYEYEYVEVDEEEEPVEATDEVTEDEEDTEPLAAEATAEATAASESEPEPTPEPTPEPEAEPEAEEAPEAALETAAEADDNNGETQMDLFASPEESAGAEESAEPEAAVTPVEGEDHSDAESGEDIVVIQPQPSPALVATKEAREAAELILSESRVAVSLLQRKIGLDFKQSCVILDELQELGFIGPYIDGKQRDILMDREEWLCAVGTE